MNFQNNKKLLIAASLVGLLLISYFFFFRIDLTTDKRYSVSNKTKKLMENIQDPLEVVVYLDGDLNPGFQRLKKSTAELLDELGVYSGKSISVRFENPSAADNQEQRENRYRELQARGLEPTAVYERDKEGKSIQKVLFPWIEISYRKNKVPICLLKNIRGNSGEENLNISIENLEFELTDGIRRLVNTQVSKIAFMEGHGELTEAETYDICKSLSRYFQIDRGVLGMDASILNQYKAIIIAKPNLPFTENEKYIIDQYIMNGGRVLWVMDAVRIAKENLSKTGMSPAIELDLNLNDQLFRYGVRINPILMQDIQCASMPMNIAAVGAPPKFEPTPWFFSPLLLASDQHPVTRNITEVRAEFSSGIDIVGDNKMAKPSLLLATSNNSHIVSTPTTIDLRHLPKASDGAYFNMGYIPVAVALEGVFESNFANRILPTVLKNTQPFRKISFPTRQIFIADGDIIRNETNGIASDSTTSPLGYDRYMRQQFGNKDFILNSVLYLADNEGWMQLRNRTLKLRLLNKRVSNDERIIWQLSNTLLPILLLVLSGFVYQLMRKRKYTKIDK